MENTVNLRRQCYVIIVVIILSHNLNTQFKSNKRLIENGASRVQMYQLSRGPVLVIKPYWEHYQDSVNEEQFDLYHLYDWILLSYFNRSRMPDMCPKQDQLHCFIRIAISKTERNSSKSIEKYNETPFHRESLLKENVIVKHERTHVNIMEYILFCLYIVIVFVNNPIIFKPRFCKDDFGRVQSYVDRQRCFKSSTLKNAKESFFEMLFDLRFQSVPKINIVTSPSSFESYLQDIKNKSSKQDLMKNEWARYTSFRYFPKSSNMSPIRLAQAGFFYSGVGESVTCFSCGQKYETWTEDETALEVHQRISPNCAFVRGEETTNISIHGSTNEEMNRSGNSYSNSSNKSSCDHQLNGANGGPGDIKTEKSSTNSASETFLSPNKEHREPTPQTGKLNVNQTPVCEESLTTFSKATTSCPGINPHETSLSPSEEGCYEKTPMTGNHNRDKTQSPFCEESYIVSSTSNPNATGSTAMNNTTRSTISTRMSYDNAKHQEYAVKSVREASYTGWREHMSPEELSEAGFYYAGFQDCVRCFYCGGGLKNWDYGDSPWVEHARWYPNCDYLKQVKGEELVQMYREDSGNDWHQETQNNMTNVPEMNAACIANEGNINMHHTLDVDMNSAAVASVLEMGYTRDTVEITVSRYRQMNGNRAMTAESLMNIILDSDQTNITPNSPNTSAANITTALNISTRAETAQTTHPTNCNDKNTSKKKDKLMSKKTNTTTNASKKEDLTSLVEENRSLREQMMCKICMDNDANIVFLPCGHLVACTECAPAIRKCAVCRKLIKGTVRAFPS